MFQWFSWVVCFSSYTVFRKPVKSRLGSPRSPDAYQSQLAMEALLRSIGKLQYIITTCLESGDPNIIVLEAEMAEGVPLPAMIWLKGLEGTFIMRMVERKPLPTPSQHGRRGDSKEGQAKTRKLMINGASSSHPSQNNNKNLLSKTRHQ